MTKVNAALEKEICKSGDVLGYFETHNYVSKNGYDYFLGYFLKIGLLLLHYRVTLNVAIAINTLASTNRSLSEARRWKSSKNEIKYFFVRKPLF